MKFLILTILLIPLTSFAQGSEIIQIGEKEIPYTEASERDDSTSYYRGTTLVASTHDRNGNGRVDVWLEYSKDEVVYEAHDVDGDGAPDTFIKLRDDEVQSIEGTPEAWQKVESVDYTELIEEGVGEASAQEDLVGDLKGISIPKYHNYKLYVFILILIGGGYWWYRRGERTKE